MDRSPLYVAISIAAVAVVAVLVFVVRRGTRASRLSPSASLAFAFVVAGILFGEERWLGYDLMAVGVALAVVDIVRRSRSE